MRPPSLPFKYGLKLYHNNVKESAVRLPILLAVLILGSVQAMGEEVVYMSQTWVGRSNPQSVFNRCTDVAGEFMMKGRAVSPKGDTRVYEAISHSGAIDNACHGMTTVAAFHCLTRVRHEQMVAGVADREHYGNPGMGHRNFHELSPGVVTCCIHNPGANCGSGE